MNDLIDRFVFESRDRAFPAATPRRQRLFALPGKVDAVIGMRRSGKTWLLFDRISTLLAEGVTRERILYVNFEDERLRPLSAGDLQEFPEALYRHRPESRDELCHFFLDEIHVVPGWEQFVRRLSDDGKVQVAVSGSSAALLSREIATSLRGRSLATEVLPFGFDEALRHQGIDTPRRFPVDARTRSTLERAFGRYMEVGGFPEVQKYPAEIRIRMLQEYAQVAVFRDVVERHAVGHVQALQQVVRQLLAAPAQSLSVNKLFQGLKSQGFRLAKDTLYSDLRHLEDAFLIGTVEIDSPSARVRMTNPRKCYLIDPGLAHAFSLRAAANPGHLLENIVYLELRRRGYEIAYILTASGREVDFVVRKAKTESEMIQACADMTDPGTRQREISAIEEAFNEGRAKRATIVTLRQEETIRVGRRAVRLVPAWRWLLEGLPRGATHTLRVSHDR